ncbi:MAG: allantoate amidohydrolase [Rhizobiales bacterium]|nr:allantoate amidohydrolase [Hyphomicrobiales bacterium]
MDPAPRRNCTPLACRTSGTKGWHVSDDRLGRRAMARLDALAQHSDEPGKLTRLYLSAAHKAAAEELAGWMREAGLTVSIDALGTVLGRYESASPGAPALLIGSHIDTVRDAGRYDGALGVIAGLVAVEELAKCGENLPFAIEVVAFGDEEGVRFPTTLTSSRALAGQFDPAVLDLCDADGVSLRNALTAFGCDPAAIATIARSREQVLAYIEVHIEQGPVLEAADLPVGVVTAINGVRRLAVEVIGEAGHAGTVPMRLRRDALAAAAEMALAVERAANSSPDVLATVGRMEVSPGAVNVIPGNVRFTIDIRSPEDKQRDAATEEIVRSIRKIAAARRVELSISTMHEAPATACAPVMIDTLTQAVQHFGLAPHLLPSGAGHDAMAIARLCPVGMLFVRCAGGISHNPKEAISLQDADICVRILLEFLRNFKLK